MIIKERAIVIRYAEAFIVHARKEIGLAQALADITAVKNLLRDTPQLKEFLDAGDITAYEKAGLMERVLKGSIAEVSFNFLKLLLDKKRMGLFLDIAEYLRVTYAHEGEEPVLLRSSLMLDLSLIKRLEDKLKETFGRKFKFYIDVDSTLLGGIQVIIGNTILDGSLRKRLFDLKEKLKGTEAHV